MLLFNEFPHYYRSFTHHPHKIDTAGQGADINLCFGFGDFLLQKLLTIKIQYGNVTLEGWSLFS
jgi:hypothetical protein